MRRFQPGHSQRRGGFTLTELIVVIAIVVIMMGITISAVQVTRNSEVVRTGARQAQSYYEGARTRAFSRKAPVGVRLLPEVNADDPDDKSVITSMVYIAEGEIDLGTGRIIIEEDINGNGDVDPEEDYNGDYHPVNNPGFTDDGSLLIFEGNLQPYGQDWGDLFRSGLLKFGQTITIGSSGTKSTHIITDLSPIDPDDPEVPQVPVYLGGSLNPSNPSEWPRYHVMTIFPGFGVVPDSNGEAAPVEYELQLAPTIFEKADPIILPQNTVIDLKSSVIPGNWDIAGTDSDDYFDIMFSPRGTVLDEPGAAGLIHLVVARREDVELNLRIGDLVKVPISAALEVPTTPPTVSARDSKRFRGDLRIVSIFTQSGTVTSSRIDPTDSDDDYVADDPFAFANTGE